MTNITVPDTMLSAVGDAAAANTTFQQRIVGLLEGKEQDITAQWRLVVEAAHLEPAPPEPALP